MQSITFETDIGACQNCKNTVQIHTHVSRVDSIVAHMKLAMDQFFI